MIIGGVEHPIEIEITTDCNLKCLNCDRSCRQAPSKEQITLDQIKKFIQQSKDNNIQWFKGFSILGGEPTLHKDLNKIIEILLSYHRNVRLLTNGINIPKTINIFKHFKNFDVINSEKENIHNRFLPFNLAPVDEEGFNIEDTLNYCKVITFCGIGLSRYGFYVCGVAASIDRIFGHDIGIKDIKDFNLDKMNEQRRILCKYCGFLNRDFKKDERIRDKILISKTWQEAYEKYKLKKPELELY